MIKLLGHPCLFLKYTGLYCPGCGGTRAVKSLLRGQILSSLWYHPIVLYTSALFLWWIVGCGIRYRSREIHGRSMKFHISWLWTGLGIILCNWIFHNVLLIGGHPL